MLSTNAFEYIFTKFVQGCGIGIPRDPRGSLTRTPNPKFCKSYDSAYPHTIDHFRPH